MKMMKLPIIYLKRFLDGKYGSNGMVGLTFNEKVLDRLAKSLHISSIMKKTLLALKEVSTSRDVSHQKEEGCSRIIEDEKNHIAMHGILLSCLG